MVNSHLSTCAGITHNQPRLEALLMFGRELRSRSCHPRERTAWSVSEWFLFFAVHFCNLEYKALYCKIELHSMLGYALFLRGQETLSLSGLVQRSLH